jgi:hypothetical protein
MKKQSKKTSQPKGTSAAKKSDTNSKEEFPGYPLYPASEDIMNRANRLDADIEEVLESGPIATNVSQPSAPNAENPIIKGGSNLTRDDLQALASDEIESDGDDEILKDRVWPVDFAGDDLDVPGSESDDRQEQLGSEDEENNSYSIGSDRHRGLEEDPS